MIQFSCKKRLPIFVILLTISLSACQKTQVLKEKEQLEFQSVFTFDEEAGEEGFGYRIPALAVSNKGTVLAFAERRVGLHDHAQNDIVLKRSLDNGKSWEEEHVVAEDGKNSLNDPCVVVLESGRILLIYQRFPYGYHARNEGWIKMANLGYDGPRNTKSLLIYSDDDGLTWSAPRDITRQVRRQDAISVGSPGTGIQLVIGETKGRIILPLYETIPVGDGTRVWRNSVAYSDNNGDSWQLSEIIPHEELEGYANEAQVVELTDTSVMLSARNQGGKFRKYTISKDGGETWMNMKIDYNLPGTNCMGTIIRYSWPCEIRFQRNDEVNISRGRPEEGESMILFANPSNKDQRTNGMVRISYNEGRTWTHSREVYSGSYAYSYLTKLPDGKVGLLFETNGYKDIYFTSFSINWVQEGRNRSSKNYFSIPLIDLTNDSTRQVIVDKEEGQYLGHPTTVLLEDNKTIYCVYPKGHGRGAIVMKRSDNAGLTWSERLLTPKSWETSKEVPTIYRVIDPEGIKRLIMFSGLYPIRMAVSEDDGKSWSELEPIGDFGGIVAMGCLIPLRTGKGHYMALFHDDHRFFTENGAEIWKKKRRLANDREMTLFNTFSYDGGLTWSYPEEIYSSWEIHVCEPGFIRSPDGNQIAVLLRENSRRFNSQIIFSNDEGKTWTEPRPLPNSLTGDRHVLKYSHDSRILATFRDVSASRTQFSYYMNKTKKNDVDKLAKEFNLGSPTEGDWVAWVGTYQDLVEGNEGQYRLRLKDNTRGWDTCYPGLELLPDGTFIATTYGHWDKGEQPYILSVRFKLEEIDELANQNN